MALSLTLAALALCGLIFAAGRRKATGRPLNRWLVVGGIACAPILMLLALLGAGANGAYQIALTDVLVGRGQVARAPITLGGDVKKDALVAPRTPAGILTLEKAGEDGMSLSLSPGEGPTAAVIKAGDDILGAKVIEPGAIFCIAACDGPEPVRYQLAEDGKRLIDLSQPDLALPQMPTRTMLPKASGLAGLTEGLSYWTPEQRVYPVRDFGRPQGADTVTLSEPCEKRFVCVRAGKGPPLPVRSFLYRVGGLAYFGGGGWRLVLLDPGARLEDETGEPFDGKLLEHRTGEEAVGKGFSILRVSFVDSEVNPGAEDAPGARLVESRRLIATMTDEGARFALAEPYTVTLRYKGLAEWPAESEETIHHVVEVSGADAPPAAGGDINLTGFSPLGGAVGRAVFGQAELRMDGPDRFRLLSGQGRQIVAFGSPFTLGLGRPDTAEHALARFRLDRLSPPLLMLVLPIAWAALVLAAFGRWLAERPLVFFTLCAFQFMLALRWLVGWEAAVMDNELDWRSLSAAGACAYVLPPALLLALSPLGTTAGLTRLILAGFGFLVVAVGWLAFGSVGKIDLVFLIGLMAAAGWGLLTGLWNSVRPKRLRAPKAARAESAAAADPPPRKRGLFSPVIDLVRKRPGMMGALLVAAAGGMRLLVLGIGVKERFPPPINVAVTVVFVPALLVGLSLLLAAAPKENRWRTALIFCALLFGAVIVAPMAASDSGFPLVTIAPLCLFAFFALRHGFLSAEREALGKWLAVIWLAPIGVVAAGVMAVGFATVGGDFLGGHVERAKNGSEAEAVEALNSLADLSQSELRILKVLRPRLVAEAGTREAEQLAAWSVYLDGFTGDLFGKGYLAPARLGPLQEVHHTDNQTAVHLMAPFGRLGAAALLALLCLYAVQVHRAAGPPAKSDENWRPEGVGIALSAWLLFGVGAYMVLANLQVIPFTGRNLYLLAPSSDSDLLEGVSLFMAIGLIAGWRRIG